ncbi:MAG: tetratricopeptide repeat protein, partial [Chloroflexi bacterium]|nr:tetratricopeptide repeat protein [Chloroflexota bacterium]
VIRWEQGEVLPESKALVLELARHLKLDEQETRQLLEASLTALAPHWSVPLPRNPYFTGREEILEALHTQLGIDRAVALTQSSALHGLGGMGKTQIALEYAYRHALEYSAVFWIGAEIQEQMVSSFLRVAWVLGLPERDDKDQQRVVVAVQHWLSTHRQWLLIWDNVEDLDLLQRFLPSARRGANLLTTRCQTLGTLTRGLDLAPMEQEEGMLFLLRRAKVLSPDASGEDVRFLAERTPAQYQAAAALVEAMGGLPLALDQAGAYLEATRCGLPAYLELFRARRVTLLQLRGEGAREHPASVSTTFTLSLTATTRRHPAVGDLLRICALLQPDAIPEELFRQGGEHLGSALAPVCGDPLEWDRLLGVACSYSLLARQPETHTLSLHRLVQSVLLESMTEAEREIWTRRVLRAIEAVFPEVLMTTTAYVVWKQCERLVPLALLCLQHQGSTKEALACAELAYKVAQYHQYLRGQYREAEPLYLRALQIQEHALGATHPAVASTLNSLANLYWRQGKYAEAEPLHLRALQIREQALGPIHPEVANPLNSLATLYRGQGKYAEAEPLCQRALQIREQTLGPTHPAVAHSLNNLALLSRDQGKYGEAEALYQRALRIWEQALGPEHSLVSRALHGLANLSRNQEKYEEAETLYRRALSIQEQRVGLSHPDVAEMLHNLALLRQRQGNLSETMTLAEYALAIRLQALGEDHPKTAASRELYTHLVQEQESAQVEAASRHRLEAIPDPGGNERYEDGTSSLLHEAGTPASSVNDPLQAFLDASCELHPRAWCRSADLWQAYEYWVEQSQERYPLSRGIFIAQLKARGCHADRTKTARIWRGIALVKTGDDGG